MNALITITAIFAIAGIAYAIYEAITHDKRATNG